MLEHNLPIRSNLPHLVHPFRHINILFHNIDNPGVAEHILGGGSRQ